VSEQLQAQVVELQTQLAFQEEAISELNQALILQQAQLVQLQEQWDVLRQQYTQQLQEQTPATAAIEPPPPHY
jgi:SlyX protein